MKIQISKVTIKEQVENKIGSILKEKYHEKIAERLFESSLLIIDDSVHEVGKHYYIPYDHEIKENYIKETIKQISEWKHEIQDRSKEGNITDLDKLLSKRITNILEEYIETLEEKDIDKRQRKIYLVSATVAITLNKRIEEIIQYPSSIELCRINNWKVSY
jgi:hypothetical protein